MNSWVNRIGQLLLVAVALFFLSCQEDPSEIGFRNPNSKTQYRFVEIPLNSSVFRRDSVRTSNFYYQNEPTRLLVGQYSDLKFGKVTANGFSKFYPISTSKINASSAFDSVVLTLQFDFYHYGSKAATEQSISIYEAGQVYVDSLKRNMFSKTELQNQTLLGSRSFTVDPAKMDEAAKSGRPDTIPITVTVKLDPAFGQRLFQNATNFRDAPTDSADAALDYLNYSRFVQIFKGITIMSDNGDKILGISPSSSRSIINVHYHHNDADSLVVPYTFSAATSFSQVTSDRAGTELDQLTQYDVPGLVDSDNRYIQSGIGISTKIDFSNFYLFADTVSNIMINSAELVVDGVSSDLPPPSSLALRLIGSNGLPLRFSSAYNTSLQTWGLSSYVFWEGQQSSSSSSVYAIDAGPVVYYASADRSLGLSYSSSKNAYSGVYTILTQRMFNSYKGSSVRDVNEAALFQQLETSTIFRSAGKSVNRAVFPKSGIKLRVYYTKPTVNQ